MLASYPNACHYTQVCMGIGNIHMLPKSYKIAIFKNFSPTMVKNFRAQLPNPKIGSAFIQ